MVSKYTRMFKICLLLLSLGTGAASSNTVHIPVTEIEYFLENGQAPEDADMTFPTFLTSTIILSVNPLDRIFDTAEVTVFGQALKYFYEQIFDSQSEYDLTVRAVDVVDQDLQRGEKILDMETMVDVNFRPSPEDQVLTQEEFHNIVLNLVNKFQDELVQYLKDHHVVFNVIDSIEAFSPESQANNNTDDNDKLWLYVIAGVGGFIMMGALVASYVLYKREWHMPRYVSGKARTNISPFRDAAEETVTFPSKDTLVLDDDEDDFAAFGSNRFSFRPGYKTPESPEPSYGDNEPSSYASLPSPSSRRSFDGGAFGSLNLTLDDVAKSPIKESDSAARVELWAPAGKLGVAIDVVEGQPLVWRIKTGSPLEGFLEKGDHIVAIDEIDTTRMSAADVTSVMVRRMRQRRKITYVRPEP